MRPRHENWLLSGGIGSGKSTVRRLLESAGLSTIDADSIGHQVLEPGGDAEHAVATAWPEVLVDGEIDRGRLGSIVFGNPERLEKLESLTHPHIFSIIEGMVEASNDPVIVEVPLLLQPFESPWRRIVVDAPDGERLKRAVSRGQDSGDVKRRMAAQPSRSEWLAAAVLVVPNHRTIEDLRQVVDLACQHLIDSG